jgi:hypothetical protein
MQSKKYWLKYYTENKDKISERKRLKHLQNPEIRKAIERKAYLKNRDNENKIIKQLLVRAQKRAVKKEIAFNLEETDITLPQICPILNVPFSRRDIRYSYSLDRINVEEGYIKGNIQVISQLANAMKWDSTKEERFAFAKHFLKEEHNIDIGSFTKGTRE